MAGERRLARAKLNPVTEPMWTRAWLGLGSNQGDSIEQMVDAVRALDQRLDTAVSSRSSIYRTPPWGGVQQADFFNAVIGVCTRLAALQLLRVLLGLEQAAGRQRSDERWGPRVLDLDVLLFGQETRDEQPLILPHPRLHERAFALLPLREVAGNITVPGRGKLDDLLLRVSRDEITCLGPLSDFD